MEFANQADRMYKLRRGRALFLTSISLSLSVTPKTPVVSLF